MSNVNKYLKLAKSTTNYASRMNRLSKQVFGDPVRETNSKSMRVVKMFSEKPIHKIDEIVNYYPRHVEIGILFRNLRDYGLFRDEHWDFKDEMKRCRLLRGKKAWVEPEKMKQSRLKRVAEYQRLNELSDTVDEKYEEY